MKGSRLYVSTIFAVALVFCAPGAFALQEGAPQNFPGARTETYVDSSGKTRIYMAQEPEYPVDSPNILIYMHGSAGGEEQGMDPEWADRTFTRLRELMNDWGWVYVCPRDAEFSGLLDHLRNRYRPRGIYLSGASAGGSKAVREAARNPSAYAGLLLMCPVLREGSLADAGKLTMPIWIVSGERDRRITGQVRVLVEKFKALNKPYFYREIAGGHHGTPVEKVDWSAALRFLQERRYLGRRLACI